jgi:hypothetical protein
VPGRIEPRKLVEIISQVDVMEGYNARAPMASDDHRAREFAAQHRIPVVAGSDGHFASEIGRAWTEMEDFCTAQEFVHSLRRARLHFTDKTCLLVPMLTVASIPVLTLVRQLRLLYHRSSGRASAPLS